ncbi:MAG: hypothetical protein HQL71_10575 [Magnetococcales bacterium]|nr:hypothetical protein [Magnetococcales bacterium]
MKKIEILIVVDTASALSTRNLQDNVYMVDSNQWLGSWKEGSCQLHTVTENGQLLVWSVCAVSPDSQVNITSFSGQMISQKVCVPQSIVDDAWEGRIESRGATGRYPYTITLSVEGNNMRFSPFMEIQ